MARRLCEVKKRRNKCRVAVSQAKVACHKQLPSQTKRRRSAGLWYEGPFHSIPKYKRSSRCTKLYAPLYHSPLFSPSYSSPSHAPPSTLLNSPAHTPPHGHKSYAAKDNVHSERYNVKAHCARQRRRQKTGINERTARTRWFSAFGFGRRTDMRNDRGSFERLRERRNERRRNISFTLLKSLIPRLSAVTRLACQVIAYRKPGRAGFVGSVKSDTGAPRQEHKTGRISRQPKAKPLSHTQTPRRKKPRNSRPWSRARQGYPAENHPQCFVEHGCV